MVLGEGGCEMVGEDVIMSEMERVAGSGMLGWRKTTRTGNGCAHHSRAQLRQEGIFGGKRGEEKGERKASARQRQRQRPDPACQNRG